MVLVGRQNMKGFVTSKTRVRNLDFYYFFFFFLASSLTFITAFEALRATTEMMLNGIFFTDGVFFFREQLFMPGNCLAFIIRKRIRRCLAGLLSAHVSDPGGQALTCLHSSTVFLLTCPYNPTSLLLVVPKMKTIKK